MTTISFMTANYVARQIGYNMTEGWMQGDNATNAYFEPLETYPARFAGMLAEIKGLGFSAIDLWLAHLNWRWATDDHIAIAQQALLDANLTVVSLAGGFGATREEFTAACRLARAMGVGILGGGTPLLQSDRPALAAIAREYGVRFGYENHPEHSSAELLEKIGAGDEDVIGACVDTGWFGTHGYDAAQALREVGPRLIHLHLKDVAAQGGHDTVRLGTGVVQVRECVAVLKEIGYTGGISIEHEPEHYNPDEDVKAGLGLMQEWMSEAR